MIAPRPYALLAEITYRCPLHCPYCSNPTQTRSDQELTTNEWTRVIREAAALGVLQIGFSGGEPLARRDLQDLVRAAREANLYTNLITSGIGLDDDRVRALRDAGLDSVQLSFQSNNADLADEIAGARAHQSKLDAAAKIRAAGIPLSLNFVIHRRNIDRLAEMIALAESLQAERVELANVQFYGWAFLNRAALLPTREQVVRAREIATHSRVKSSTRLSVRKAAAVRQRVERKVHRPAFASLPRRRQGHPFTAREPFPPASADLEPRGAIHAIEPLVVDGEALATDQHVEPAVPKPRS